MKKMTLAIVLLMASLSSFASSQPETLFIGKVKQIVEQTDEGCLVRVAVQQSWESVVNPLDTWRLEEQGVINPRMECSEVKIGDHIDGVAYENEMSGKIYLE